MPTQAERETQFIWRPNDNSVTTRTRYDLEAEHWYRSFKSAERKYNRPSFQETIGVIGLVLSLIVNLIWLVGLLIVKLFNWIRKK